MGLLIGGVLRARSRTFARECGVRRGMVSALAIALLLSSACGSDPAPTTGGVGHSSTSGQPAAGPVAESGEIATWTIDASAPPMPSSSVVAVRVTRLGCSGGETGRVLRPGVVFTDTQVVITLNVEPLPKLSPNQGYACPGNNAVPYEVPLGRPVGTRALVDGSCGLGEPAATTSYCSEDGGVRWKAGA